MRTFGLIAVTVLASIGAFAVPARSDESAAQAIAEKFARASAGSQAAEAADNERRAALAAEREAETLRLAERLRQARRQKSEALNREQRQRDIAEQTDHVEHKGQQVLGICPQSPLATVAPVIATAVSPSAPLAVRPNMAWLGHARASVLLALDPGTYGIRRFNPRQADPVLCVGDTCYISQGPDQPAKPMTRMLALGAGNTLGGRAGACRLQLTCVFRDIDLASGRAEFQPVDLHVLRHDRRETALAEPDRSCVTANGRLTCSAPIASTTWRAWIVPESTAALAGGPVLTAALSGGLVIRAASAR